MLRRSWKPIAAVVTVAGPTYYLYATKYSKATFEIPVRVKASDGKTEMSTRTLPLLSLKELEARMNERASTHVNPRPGGIIWKHTTASLPSNDPIEDANCHQILQRDDTDAQHPGDYLFFAVMDGHGGYHTSQVLSRVLINAVALELSQLVTKPDSISSSKGGLYGSAKSYLFGSPSQPAQNLAGSDTMAVTVAIQNAFAKLDNELINAPLRVLANNIDEESRKSKIIPDLSQHPLSLTAMLPAVSGSCALMALFDTANRDLYIACTGDSRAVAGVWEPSGNGDGKGSWRVEALSEDQTGRNPDEMKRIQSEHPADEADYVIRGGRVLGGLEPSRAFGDARYKWPRAIQETLNQAFLVGNNKPMRPPPSLFKTPPYVTARPVVTHRKLFFKPTTDEKALRFLVLATDGLWDQLTSEEVVSLVGGHLAGLKGSIPKSTLPDLIPTTSGTPTVDGKEKNSTKGSVEDGSWAFKDENLSVHLIRNAFGGGDELALRQRLSIPAPYSRRYRDDVTVTVVWWEEGNEAEAKVSTFSEALKSKL
ncbi:protein serine/threonine phosphatase 2C [Pluteus cervinus]|uniref:Protein serine/threonine phosphatase 2C n=1 Tax=Pluteus cervinus TaxID=181527 RepID=A0ACD3ARN0_9AGAR|nr:protein serine/threonine phosphatase 2C [Pluteus cervinus]